jgi:hypothetical protein
VKTFAYYAHLILLIWAIGAALYLANVWPDQWQFWTVIVLAAMMRLAPEP